MELTQAGFDFYSYVRKMLPEYHRAVDRLQMYREGGTYPLRIGSLPLAEEYGFANAFSSYWARNTSVQMDYFERSQEDLIDKLDRHKIDLALIRVDMLDPDKYSYVPLALDEIVIACSTKHPLSAREHVGLAELRNEEFILLEEKSDVTQIFRRACENQGFYPNAPLHHSRHRMLIKAVQNNMGITALPRRLVSTYLADNLAIVSLKQPLYSTLGLVWLADEPLTPINQKFIDYVCTDFNVNSGLEG